MSQFPTSTDCCAPTEVCEIPYDIESFCGPAFSLCEDYCTCSSDKNRPQPCADLTSDQIFCAKCAESKACLDLSLENDDLVTSGGILGMVLAQLMIKGRVVPNPEDLEDCNPSLAYCNDYGGWWYDSFSGNATGSRLWPLEGRDIINGGTQIQLEAEQIIQEDLKFMIDNGWVRKFEINSEIDECGVLCIRHIDVFEPNSDGRLRAEVDCLWQPPTTA